MGLIAKDLPALVFMLLPGFMAAGVFYTLTAHPKASEFERIIQSLIFTTLIKFLNITTVVPLVLLVGRQWRSFGKWDADSEFVWSILLAFLIGLFFALLANKDWFHWATRAIRLSTRTSYPSEWYGAFASSKRHVVLHLKGDRRLRGWPLEWPDQPDKGHFVITHPEWLLDDNQVAPLYQVHRLMLPATEVEMVEFLKSDPEIQEDQEEIDKAEKLLLDARQKEEEKKNGSESPPAGA